MGSFDGIVNLGENVALAPSPLCYWMVGELATFYRVLFYWEVSLYE